jgi:hypothetical protein
MQSLPSSFGKRGGFRVAKDLDGLLRRIDYQTAIAAFPEMLLDGVSEVGVEGFVQIVSQLVDNSLALHNFPPARK